MANSVESVVRLYGSVSSISLFEKVHMNEAKDDVLFERFLGEGESSCGAYVCDACYREGADAQPYEASLYLYIDSRWGEPMDWFRKIVALHHDLTFEISWSSAESLFVGSLDGVDGLVTKEEHRSDRELTVNDLFIMGIGDCEACECPSVEVLFGEECPTCAERELEGGK